MEDVTALVAEGVDIGGHAAVPYFTDQGLLLGFDSGIVEINKSDIRSPGWEQLVQLPGPILSLCVASRSPSAILH